MDHLLIRKPINNDNIIKYADDIDWGIFCANGDLSLVNADSLSEVEDCLFFDSIANNLTITEEISKRFISKMNYGILIRNVTYFSEIATDEEVKGLLNIVKPDNFEKYVSIALTQRGMFDVKFFEFVLKVFVDNKLNNAANNPIRLFVILLISNFEQKNLGYRVLPHRKKSMRNKGDKLFMHLYESEQHSTSFKKVLTGAIYNFMNMNTWQLQSDLLPDKSRKIIEEYIKQESLSSIMAQDMIDATLKDKK